MSTISWIILVFSSFLAHHSTTASAGSVSAQIARPLSVILRRLGKVVASFNAMWIVVTCLFQFSNFFDRCYCNSSVFGWGEKAFFVISLTHEDVAGMKGAWIGGAFLAAGSVIICVIFVNLFINPQLPE
jgi:hypothetical protein